MDKKLINYRRKKYILLIVFLIVLVFPVIFYQVVQYAMGEKGVPIKQIAKIEEADYIIVPGGAVSEFAVSNQIKDRLKAAAELYHQGKAKKILLSGGYNEKSDIYETDSMWFYLESLNIPAEDVYIDNKGYDTYTTLARAQKFFQKESAIVCTQEKYVQRTLYLSSKLHLNIQGIQSDTMFYDSNYLNSAREFFAATKAVVEGNFKVSNNTKVDIIQADSGIPKKVEKPEEEFMIQKVPLRENYDPQKAVTYALNFAKVRNERYASFENNCTNFVSQCLVAGGVEMKGGKNKGARIFYDSNKESWYSFTEGLESNSYPNYTVSTSFVRANEFVEYFTTQLKMPIANFENTREGKIALRQNARVGDVLILYKENKRGNMEVVHLGIISYLDEEKLLFCANTADYVNHDVANLNDEYYKQFAIININGRGMDE